MPQQQKQQQPAPYFSFLFVINRVTYNPSFSWRDEWGVFQPPDNPDGYLSETPGTVFRFERHYRANSSSSNVFVQRVTPAGPQFTWARPVWGQEGAVVVAAGGGGGGGMTMAMEEVATYTVFRGWRFRPVVFFAWDGTVEEVDDEGDGPGRMFHNLSFDFRQVGNAGAGGGGVISKVGARRPGVYVPARDPAWLERLVPGSLRNPFPGAPRSVGLGGDVALVLGLMALSQRPGREEDAFTSGNWRADGTWHGSRRAWSFDGEW